MFARGNSHVIRLAVSLHILFKAFEDEHPGDDEDGDDDPHKNNEEDHHNNDIDGNEPRDDENISDLAEQDETLDDNEDL